MVDIKIPSTVGLAKDTLPTNYIAWSSILAGLMATIAIESAINLLGVGLGFTLFTRTQYAVAGLSLGGIIWFTLSGTIALFSGGWLASWLAELHSARLGMIYGFMVWCALTIFGLLLATSVAGSLLGGIADITNKGLSMAAQTSMQLPSQVIKILPQQSKILQEINQQAKALVEQDNEKIKKALDNAGKTPEEAWQDLKQTIGELLTNDDKEKIKDNIVTLAIKYTDMEHADAEKMVTQWINNFQSMQEQATHATQQFMQQTANVAKQSAKVVGQAAITTFIILIFGAIAAVLGGRLGVKTDY